MDIGTGVILLIVVIETITTPECGYNGGSVAAFKQTLLNHSTVRLCISL